MRCLPISLPTCLSFNVKEWTPCKVVAVVSGTLFTISSLAMLGLLLAHSPITSTFIGFQVTTFAGFSASLLVEFCRQRNSNLYQPVTVDLGEGSPETSASETAAFESARSSSSKSGELKKTTESEKVATKPLKEEEVSEIAAADTLVPKKEKSLVDLFLKHNILVPVTSDQKRSIVIDPKSNVELIAEFEALKEYGFQDQGPPPSDLVAAQPKNAEKLRYQNIYTWDQNRYQMANEEDRKLCPYINASVLVTDDIVTQGPGMTTIEDFWLMVWDAQKSPEEEIMIVMTTNLVEGTQIKCAQYWPETNVVENLEKIQMKIKTTQISENKDINSLLRTFKLIRNGEERNVHQLHIKDWKDHEKTAVDRIKTIIEALHGKDAKKVRKIVHCSAGADRSMTLEACEMLYMLKKEIETIEEKQESSFKLNLVEFVKYLRLPPNGRVNAVISPDLYMMLYEFAASQFPLNDGKKSKEKKPSVRDTEALASSFLLVE